MKTKHNPRLHYNITRLLYKWHRNTPVNDSFHKITITE